MKVYRPQMKRLNGIAVWLSERSGWTVESIEDQHLNIVKYKTLKGSSYIELPPELRNPAKGLINFQNNDNECFIRHSNPQEIHPERIQKCDSKIWIILMLPFQWHKKITEK